MKTIFATLAVCLLSTSLSKADIATSKDKINQIDTQMNDLKKQKQDLQIQLDKPIAEKEFSLMKSKLALMETTGKDVRLDVMKKIQSQILNDKSLQSELQEIKTLIPIVAKIDEDRKKKQKEILDQHEVSDGEKDHKLYSAYLELESLTPEEKKFNSLLENANKKFTSLLPPFESEICTRNKQNSSDETDDEELCVPNKNQTPSEGIQNRFLSVFGFLSISTCDEIIVSPDAIKQAGGDEKIFPEAISLARCLYYEALTNQFKIYKFASLGIRFDIASDSKDEPNSSQNNSAKTSKEEIEVITQDSISDFEKYFEQREYMVLHPDVYEHMKNELLLRDVPVREEEAPPLKIN